MDRFQRTICVRRAGHLISDKQQGAIRRRLHAVVMPPALHPSLTSSTPTGLRSVYWSSTSSKMSRPLAPLWGCRAEREVCCRVGTGGHNHLHPNLHNSQMAILAENKQGQSAN